MTYEGVCRLSNRADALLVLSNKKEICLEYFHEILELIFP